MGKLDWGITIMSSRFQRTVGLMGYVYVFRHGREDEFKFGRTTNLQQRRKTLRPVVPSRSLCSTSSRLPTIRRARSLSFVNWRING